MNIVNGRFDNNINLAVCIFATDLLRHGKLKSIMTDYTLFYAYRIRQVSSKLDIVFADSIDDGLVKYGDQYNHLLFMAAGARIYDAEIIIDIAKEIDANPNYFAAAHILEWQDKWYELHHQFVLVNTSTWKQINCPAFGGWVPAKEELVVVERSKENFHDDYTPLWIKDTGQREVQWHYKQGWNFIDKGLRAGVEIINWNQSIRNKRTYYYPETMSDAFYEAYRNRRLNSSITNYNQQRFINEISTGVSDQIWAVNSEWMYLHNDKKQYEVLAIPASGFKYLDAFKSNALTDNGEFVIYDYNQGSLDWIKHIHESKSNDIQELIRTFKHNQNLKWFGYNNPPIVTNGVVSKEFMDSFKITEDYFKGKFYDYLQQFRNSKVTFVKTDLINNPFDLLNVIDSKRTILHISNIFATDFLIGIIGLAEADKLFNKFKDILHPNTQLVGQCPKGQLWK
jgi:hypothetical protein